MTFREGLQYELYLLELFLQFAPLVLVALAVFAAGPFGLWKLTKYLWRLGANEQSHNPAR